MDYLCDVIVLTWNQLDIIRNFIESFLINTSLPTRLIIIDNGSTDGTRQYLLSLEDTQLHSVKVILNKENKGFGYGMNQGIEISAAPYVCLANNDLLFTPGWLEEVISVFRIHKDVGVLNPNSNNLGTMAPKGVSLGDFAFSLKEKYKGIFVEMPFCIGFCVVIKREVINKIGGLSEEFRPIFFEDTDYSMKAQKAGFLVGMSKGSYIWHKEHSSFKQMGRTREKIFKKNRNTYIKKWGRILRIAFILNGSGGLSLNLNKTVNLARQGNYVSFFIKNLNEDRASIFRRFNLFEHSGIHFFRFNNRLDLSWRVLKKKKRFDIIINTDKLTNRLFSALGYKIMDSVDEDRINFIKIS